jgi:ACS family sodium-dependent inorganic phosphate cotransporter
VTGRWPRRHVVGALTFLACVLAYTDRVNLSVAAVVMREQFGWTQTEKGFVLSAFFAGYLLFMFIGSLLAMRFGGKRVLGFSVLAWSVLTLLTPLAAMASIAMLIGARVGMGVGEASMFPGAYELYGRWAPTTERARMVARLLSGIPVGTVLGLMGTGWLVQRYGWPAAFYAFGALGLVWALVWFHQVQNSPVDDPRVGVQERELLAAQPPPIGRDERLPFGRLLLRLPILAIVVGQFASLWNLYVLISWLPSYFRDVQHLDIANVGLFSALPWLAMFLVTNLSASVSDRMIRRGVSATNTRKAMQCVGLIVCAGFLFAIRAAHTPIAALALMCAATGALGCTWCGYAVGILDVAPRHSALLTGVSNTIGTIPGIVGVALTGWLVDVTGTYAAAFMLTAAVSAAGALVFGLLFNSRPVVD